MEPRQPAGSLGLGLWGLHSRRRRRSVPLAAPIRSATPQAKTEKKRKNKATTKSLNDTYPPPPGPCLPQEATLQWGGWGHSLIWKPHIP